MCCGTELGLEVVLTFPIKWSRFAHLRADRSPRGGGGEFKAQDAAIHPNRNFGETLTHLWDPLSRQCFTHFALTSSHLYVVGRRRRRVLGDVARQAIDGMARRRPTRLCSSPPPSPLPRSVRPPAVPFCPLSPDGVLRRHWRSSRLLPPGANPEPPEDDAKRGEHGGIYAIDPVAPVGGQAGRRVCATASSSVALPLQKEAIRAESIGRPGGRQREGEEISPSLFTSSQHRHGKF